MIKLQTVTNLYFTVMVNIIMCINLYVRDYVNAKRREDLESNGISCLWLEISPVRGKSF